MPQCFIINGSLSNDFSTLLYTTVDIVKIKGDDKNSEFYEVNMVDLRMNDKAVSHIIHCGENYQHAVVYIYIYSYFLLLK